MLFAIMAWNNITIFVMYDPILIPVETEFGFWKLVHVAWAIFAGLQILSIIMIITGLKRIKKGKQDLEFQKLKDKVEALEKDKEKKINSKLI